ncbi:MAG: oxygen-dependent coproporphyrinogen oxidase [Hyphomonadaceae bacterium]|nr:oxygen-dependent coproporphyrinogen oxidase [Hyphomonadaceae bacterium]
MAIKTRKQRAMDWFRSLRNQICAEFEMLERKVPEGLYGPTPATFEYEPWERTKGPDGEDQGGGTGGMLRGRLFEKCGVHISAIHGQFTDEAQIKSLGASSDGRFWAAGISLIAHLTNPHVPAVHMNTRYVVTVKDWFGGGADLTPTQAKDRTPENPDARSFHAGMKAVCDAHKCADYARYKAWCDEYFHLVHRDEPRGIGGLFYDRHNSGDWESDFAFTQDVGRVFLKTYVGIVRRRMNEPWTQTDREEQLVQRGRYVEFNLLYDRGTTFGLKAGGNVETILSSMPPVVKWP